MLVLISLLSTLLIVNALLLVFSVNKTSKVSSNLNKMYFKPEKEVNDVSEEKETTFSLKNAV